MHYIMFLLIVSPLLWGGILWTADQMGPPATLFSSDDTSLHRMAKTIPSVLGATEISAQAGDVRDHQQEAASDIAKSNGPS